MLKNRNSFCKISTDFAIFYLANSDSQVPYGQSGYDHLFKVHTLLDLVVPKLEAEYNPNEIMTIDEVMIPFKGGLKFLFCLMQQMGTCIDSSCTQARTVT